MHSVSIWLGGTVCCNDFTGSRTAEPDVLEGLLGAWLETTSARGNKKPHESPCGSLPSGGLWLLCFRVRPECLFRQEQVTCSRLLPCQLMLLDSPPSCDWKRVAAPLKRWPWNFSLPKFLIFWFMPQSLLVICAGLILWVSSFIWTWSEPSRSAGLFGASAECQAATKPSPCQDGLRHFLHVWPWCYVHRKAQ